MSDASQTPPIARKGNEDAPYTWPETARLRDVPGWSGLSHAQVRALLER